MGRSGVEPRASPPPLPTPHSELLGHLSVSPFQGQAFGPRKDETDENHKKTGVPFVSFACFWAEPSSWSKRSPVPVSLSMATSLPRDPPVLRSAGARSKTSPSEEFARACTQAGLG